MPSVLQAWPRERLCRMSRQWVCVGMKNVKNKVKGEAKNTFSYLTENGSVWLSCINVCNRLRLFPEIRRDQTVLLKKKVQKRFSIYIRPINPSKWSFQLFHKSTVITIFYALLELFFLTTKWGRKVIYATLNVAMLLVTDRLIWVLLLRFSHIAIFSEYREWSEVSFSLLGKNASLQLRYVKQHFWTHVSNLKADQLLQQKSTPGATPVG